MKFRKKPLIIEAIQNIDSKSVAEMHKKWPDFQKFYKCTYNPYHSSFWIWVKAPGTNHYVYQNDWVIKGINGEFYPCKPGVFEMSYEKVGDGES